MAAGYSKTPLIKKLGIKSGSRILPVFCPYDYQDLVGSLPEKTQIVEKDGEELIDFIHLFAKNERVLKSQFPILKDKLATSGMIWVSWIKKSSELETDISEQDVRSLGLDLGLVDIKICAVDENWSGLKFVYRRKDR